MTQELKPKNKSGGKKWLFLFLTFCGIVLCSHFFKNPLVGLVISLGLFVLSLYSLIKKPIIKTLTGKNAVGLLVLSILLGSFAICGGMVQIKAKIESNRIEKAKAKQQEIIKEAYALIDTNNLSGAKAKLQEAEELSGTTGMKPDGIDKGLRAIKLIEGGEEAKKVIQEILKGMSLDRLLRN